MNKIKTLLKAPVLTNSGYGAHAREIFKSLNDDPLFDVHVESLKWGNTPFLSEDTEEKRVIKECVIKAAVAAHNKDEDYDLFVHVTIPNEFEKKGKINIGITAGIETDRVSHVWIQKCNEMDLIIVPSEHSKNVFEKTIVDWENSETKQKGQLKLEKPIIVCHEGVDTSVYKKLDQLYDNDIAKLDLEPEFNFLHIGQWGNGNFGEDRKNISNLVKYFIETFKGRNDVGLVLKTNMSRNNITDYRNVETRLDQIKGFFKKEDVPPIYLVHGTLTDEEMVNLYNHPKIKAFVSLTKGEGWGRPLLEAASCALPIIATNWSGHLDFLKKGKFSPVDYTMTEIPEVAVWEPIMIKGSRWATASETDAKRRMQKIVKSYAKPKEWATELAEEIKENFDVETVCLNLSDTIKQFLVSNHTAPNVQSQQQLNPVQMLEQIIDDHEAFNVLYVMPMSHGDVFVSTAIIDGLKADVPPGTKVYFATSPQYFEILEDNPNVHKIIPFHDFMLNIEVPEQVFDLVLTPNVATQLQISNWVRFGQGRNLVEEYANHCNVTDIGNFFIKEDPSVKEKNIPKDQTYMTIHVGSGKGQWEAREYEDWKEVVVNLKEASDIVVVQVGTIEDTLIKGIDIDLRGKTNTHQLASVLKDATMHMGIDSFPVHLANSFDTPIVGLYGCSYANSTGPFQREGTKNKLILLESERKTCGCKRACYKNKPVKKLDYSPINEIDPKIVFNAALAILKQVEKERVRECLKELTRLSEDMDLYEDTSEYKKLTEV